jgi:hypothetical protein
MAVAMAKCISAYHCPAFGTTGLKIRPCCKQLNDSQPLLSNALTFLDHGHSNTSSREIPVHISSIWALSFPTPEAIEMSNNEHVSYEALSYVWGSTELVECIILNQKRHWITDNLYSALQCLRLHDRDRYLWIDAICINQVNKEEQGSQVQQMGKIFSSAEGVLFWLGKATLEITSLMDTLNQYLRTGADCQLGQLTLDDDRREKCRTGLRQLLRRQWFTRVWILQEVANARKATVCSGTWSIPAEVFAQDIRPTQHVL